MGPRRDKVWPTTGQSSERVGWFDQSRP